MMNDQLQQIDVDIETLKSQIELDEALTRLEKNPDYQKIINELYFEKEPARLVLFKASPFAQQQPAVKKDIEQQIDAIGVFWHFLFTIKQQAQTARNQLDENREVREEILNEQLETVGGVQ